MVKDIKTPGKRIYFHEPTAAELRKRQVVPTGEKESLDELAARVANLDISSESLRIRTILFDETHLPPQERKDGWGWLKSVPVLNITNIQARSPEERLAIAYALRTAGQEYDHKLGGHGWHRRGAIQAVRFDDILMGAKMFKYEIAHLPDDWHDMIGPLGVSLQKSHPSTPRYGSLADTTVSAQSNSPRSRVSFYGVPVSQLTDGLTLAASGDCCENRKQMSYHYGPPRNAIDKHHVAGAFKIALFEHRNGNEWTARRLPIAFPTQRAVDFHRALDLTYVDYEIDDIDKDGKTYAKQVERPLEGHEREALWTAHARQLIEQKNFGDEFRRGSKLLDLNWYTG
jgi:hypothetical protein